MSRIVPGKRGHSTHRVGDQLPAVLVLSDLEPIFGLGIKRLWHLEQLGELKKFETRDRIGGRVRYSGKKVQAWLDGEEDEHEAAPLHVVRNGQRR